ncbi:MAG: lipoate--protein ligase family protein [Syntrophaceae bacterium]|nr:lipoate--protein ligase family protein [Syntrophaceae bacterium]
MSDAPWRFLPYRALRAAENMAIDEAVFRLNRREGLPPTLRFFGWSPPAVSLGYFQKTGREIDVGACRRAGVDIVRRPTGGKAVLHEHELTYSLVAPADHPLFTGDIIGTYRVVSACIVEALCRLGLTPEVACDGRSAAGTALEGYCFAAPSRYELLVGGRKICGSAQVRSGGAFLQHGSLLADIDPVRTASVMGVSVEGVRRTTTSLREQLGRAVGHEELAGLLRAAFEDTLGIRLAEGVLSPAEESLKERLLREKYGTDRWNLEGRGGSADEGSTDDA